MPFSVAGKVTNLFLPRLSFTVTGRRYKFFTASFIEFIVTFTLIIIYIFDKNTQFYAEARRICGLSANRLRTVYILIAGF